MRLGEVTVSVTTSRTASLFHVVDQLSGWSPFNHPQYKAWAPAPDDVEAWSLLRRHAALRAKRGWGAFEPFLYPTTLPPRDALEPALGRGSLSREEVDEEASLLTKLEPRFSTKLGGGEQRSKALRDLLEHESAAFARMLKAWLGILAVPPPPEPIPIAFVPSPSGGHGGGANGGVIVIEVPDDESPNALLSTIAHELTHILARPKSEQFAAKARECGHDLDPTAISEALSYAIAPGSFAYGSSVGQLDRIVEHTEPTTPYGRFARLAVAVRPKIKDALRNGKHDVIPDLLDAICTAASTSPR